MHIKVELQAGERKILTYKITPEIPIFIGINVEKILLPGQYTITLGTSFSEDISKQFKLVR